MARSQETFGKKEKEKKRLKKRKDKEEKRNERKSQSKSGSLEDMIAYVDENGNLSDTPPDPSKRKEINADQITVGVPKRVEVEQKEFREGVVEFFNHDKGFGFIKENESSEKHFVHIHGCIDAITEGDKVEFKIEQGLRGLNAVQVTKK